MSSLGAQLFCWFCHEAAQLSIVYFLFVFLGDTGKYYCGMKLLSCNCCDGHCGPNNGCNCGPCAQLDKEEEERKAEISQKPKPSGPMIDSWTWGQQPGM